MSEMQLLGIEHYENVRNMEFFCGLRAAPITATYESYPLPSRSHPFRYIPGISRRA